MTTKTKMSFSFIYHHECVVVLVSVQELWNIKHLLYKSVTQMLQNAEQWICQKSIHINVLQMSKQLLGFLCYLSKERVKHWQKLLKLADKDIIYEQGLPNNLLQLWITQKPLMFYKILQDIFVLSMPSTIVDLWI